MLTKEKIKELIENKNLIENFPDLETQLSENSFDLTAKKILKFKGKGQQDFSDSEQVIPETEIIKPQKKNNKDKYGWWKLKKGTYKIKTNEKVNLPDNMTGKIFPRACIVKMGSLISANIVNKGYQGNFELLLVVENPEGIELKENARIAQIVFERIK